MELLAVVAVVVLAWTLAKRSKVSYGVGSKQRNELDQVGTAAPIASDGNYDYPAPGGRTSTELDAIQNDAGSDLADYQPSGQYYGDPLSRLAGDLGLGIDSSEIFIEDPLASPRLY